jgi:enterochelin esterase-like enzyme
MNVVAGQVESAVLPSMMEYLAYLPPGSAEESGPFPVLYLLHGRGDGATSWREAFTLFDRLIADGTVPPFVAVAPDAPWSRRGGFWVDSEYEGDGVHEPGAAIATAFVRELVPHIDATLPTLDRRESRALCGYSMGGAGAITLALSHPEVFSAVIALSPAVYDPLPPNDSTARSRGAFGRGRELFETARYLELGYPAALAAVRPELPLQLFVGGGLDEEPSADPNAAPPHVEVARFAERAAATPGITAELHTVPGGHDWTTWLPLLEQALPALVPRLAG